MSIWNATKNLASLWYQNKARTLRGTGRPETKTDSGGTITEYSWQGQDLDRSQLRKVKQIRETGGLVAWLFEAKSLMKFGTGAELQSEDDELEAWLADQFPKLDLTTLDLGQDGVYYPYALGEIVETRAGEFSHIEPVEPWTMLPKTNEYGEVVYWEQETQDRRNEITRFDPEDIGSIVLNKSSARDKVGVSEVLRSEEEINQYRENQRAVNKAIEIAGFPHHVWTVGSEGHSPVNDNELRRVRNLIDNMDGDTQFVVGPDVEHDKIAPGDFDFESITRRDLRMLTTTVGLPLEVAGYGREGMGSGSETDLIGDLLAMQNEVSRRRFETQFVEEFVRPVVEQYSPFDADADITMVINPFLDERSDIADLIEKIGDYMSNAEIRDRLDLPPLEDDELAESYRTPKEVEEAEEGDQGGGIPGGDGGFFSDGRALQSVPDNAVSITDPSEAPEDANIIEGPGGGLYYVPSGGGSSDESGGESPQQTESEISDIVENQDHEALENHIADVTGVDEVDLPLYNMSDEDRVQLSATLARAGQVGLTENVDSITTETPRDAKGVFKFDDKELGFAWGLDGDEYNEEREEGYAVGDDLEHLVIHELAHSQHEMQLDPEVYSEVSDNTVAVDRSGEWVGMERVDAVEDNVSTYATKNGAELVAEMYAGLAMGQEYPDEMMDLYEEYDGPDTWRKYRGDN